jgi:D-alanyl-D-alanine carboxypeptidase
LFEPGERWHYSNAGFVVLGAIIERVSGQDYFSYVRDHIYQPAEMDETEAYELDQIVPNLAVGYTYEGLPQTAEPRQRRNNLLLQMVKGGPAGGGYSTVQDLFKFGRALRSHVLLSVSSTEVVLTEKVKIPDSAGLAYGYAFEVGQSHGKRLVGHSGGFPGMSTHFKFSPETGDSVVVLSNYDPPIAEQVAETLWSLLAQREEGAKDAYSP